MEYKAERASVPTLVTSTKFPNGIPIHIIPKEFESIMSKDKFMWFIEKLPVPTYLGLKDVTVPIVLITQGFADYLKKEPNFEKAFVEYSEFLKPKEAEKDDWFHGWEKVIKKM